MTIVDVVLHVRPLDDCYYIVWDVVLVEHLWLLTHAFA